MVESKNISQSLRLAINVSVGHAAIALSQMLGRKIQIAVSRVEALHPDDFLKDVYGDEDPLVAVSYFNMVGDLKGVVLVMFEKEHALRVCEMLLGKDRGSCRLIDEKGRAALNEVGNILTGSFFSVIAEMAGFNTFPQTPDFAFDNAKGLVRAISEGVLKGDASKTCVEAEFVESGSKISGCLIYVPTKVSMKLINERI